MKIDGFSRGTRLPKGLAKTIFVGALFAAGLSTGVLSGEARGQTDKKNTEKAAVRIVPHSAVYTLKLGATRAGNQFNGADGAITRAMEKTCDGWIMAEQLKVDITTAVGGVISRDLRFTGWESLDGTSYRFAARSKSGSSIEDFKGTASVRALGKPGVADFKMPEDKDVALPKETYFPVGQLKRLLGAAAQGERLVSFNAFDGTEIKGAEALSGFIAKRVTPDEDIDLGKTTRSKLGALAGGPAWRMTLAFFEIGGQSATPSYEIDVTLLENGIPLRMQIDFGEFELIQELTQIEALPEPSC